MILSAFFIFGAAAGREVRKQCASGIRAVKNKCQPYESPCSRALDGGHSNECNANIIQFDS